MLFFFFFQAEDGIRDYKVTGVQTCALPISTLKLSPCTKLAASESRNRTAFAISSGLPKRPMGMRPAMARCSGVSGACIGVSEGPGLTQLTRIAVPATARAKPFVMVTTAPLLEAYGMLAIR